MTKPSNPPAFPNTEITHTAIDNNGVETCHIDHRGMNLRDYFANTAMQAILARRDAEDLCNKGEQDKTFGELIAENAYFMADAMLAEREKTQ